MPPTLEQDPRVYFAAERTFLAWIRTGLGLMGVGFAVARFGLFLRTLQSTASHVPTKATGLSVTSGVAIVFLGVIVLTASVFQHLQLIREPLHRNLATRSHLPQRRPPRHPPGLRRPRNGYLPHGPSLGDICTLAPTSFDTKPATEDWSWCTRRLTRHHASQ